MMFDKRFKNLILCSNLNSDGGVVSSSDLKLVTYGLRKKYLRDSSS